MPTPIRLPVRPAPAVPRRRRGERGAATIEYLLMAPVMLGLFAMMVHFSLLAYTNRTVQAAAREGAVAAAHWDGTAATGRQTADAYMSDSLLRATEYHRVDSVTRSQETARVTVTAEVVALPLVSWLDRRVTATAEVPVERFTP